MNDLLRETADAIYYAIAKQIDAIYERDDPEYVTAFQAMEEIEDLDLIGEVIDEKLNREIET